MNRGDKILIFSSSYDQSAHQLAKRWESYGAVLVTPSDLTVAGWRYYQNNIASSTINSSGKLIPINTIAGVITRLEGIYEQELKHIVAKDRTYVAAEITAFLMAFLTEITCPVLNRPSTLSLCGPSWRQEKWLHMAAKLEIQSVPFYRTSSSKALLSEYLPHAISVTVIGNKHFGSFDYLLVKQTRSLAEAAGVDLLVAYFTKPENGSLFITASSWVDVLDGNISNAILDYMVTDNNL